MNWKEYAYLFSNGKFKFKEFKFQPNKIHTIDGYNNTFTGGCFVYEKGCLININYCTLIARKIEDMTGDERNIYNDKRMSNVMGGSTESPNSFLYALSVGCLPKCFEHQFETGEVIDIKTL